MSLVFRFKKPWTIGRKPVKVAGNDDLVPGDWFVSPDGKVIIEVVSWSKDPQRLDVKHIRGPEGFEVQELVDWSVAWRRNNAIALHVKQSTNSLQGANMDSSKTDPAVHQPGGERNTIRLEFNGRVFWVRPGVTDNIKTILAPFHQGSAPISEVVESTPVDDVESTVDEPAETAEVEPMDSDEDKPEPPPVDPTNNEAGDTPTEGQPDKAIDSEG